MNIKEAKNDIQAVLQITFTLDLKINKSETLVQYPQLNNGLLISIEETVPFLPHLDKKKTDLDLTILLKKTQKTCFTVFTLKGLTDKKVIPVFDRRFPYQN